MSTRAVALLEFVSFVALALISKRVVDLVTWRFSGPISLALTVLVLSLYVRRSGGNWAAMGLVRLDDARARLLVLPKAFLTFLAFCLTVGSILGFGAAFDLDLINEVPTGVEDRWGGLEGNLVLYLGWLGLTWTSAAFLEEMFFRGFLITQGQKVFGEGRLGSALAVMIAALIFGYGHVYYQGLRGLLVTGAIGLAFGTMFLVFKRNLWPIILIHGLIDTLVFTSRYMGWE